MGMTQARAVSNNPGTPTRCPTSPNFPGLIRVTRELPAVVPQTHLHFSLTDPADDASRRCTVADDIPPSGP